MATWAQLTQQQRDEITDLLKAVRLHAGQVARAYALGRAIVSKYVGNVETTLAGLDAGDIPVYDASKGEEPLSKDDLMTLVGYAIDSSAGTQPMNQGSPIHPTTYYSGYHQNLYVRAAGLFNTLQQGQS
jgi:hypothetical protein